MESSAKKQVDEEVEKTDRLSETSMKVMQALSRAKMHGWEHMTLGRIADEAECDAKAIGKALKDLGRRGMVRQKVLEGFDTTWRFEDDLASNPALEGLICPIKGCGFIAKTGTGLTIHAGRLHKAEQREAGPPDESDPPESTNESPPEQDPDEGGDQDEPEVLAQPTPDTAAILKRFEDGAAEIRKAGWDCEVQVKLNFPATLLKTPPGAS